MRKQALYEARWILAVLGVLWLVLMPLFLPASVLLALMILFTLYFFRDPERQPPEDPALAVSPADGVVVAVEDCDGDGLLGAPVRRVVIFLSIFDVHVNRSPIAGQIVHSEPKTGESLDARNPQASVRNARRTWVVRGSHTSVVVRQITGAVARRIVAWRQVGDHLARGQRFGMIRFGSRTEVDFPVGSDILVKVGDRVKGGQTPVAKLENAVA